MNQNHVDEVLALHFWNELLNVIPEWQMAVHHQVSGAELRQNYVHGHAVMLHAFGIAGQALLQTHPDEWPRRLQSLKSINWSRSNARFWEGRAMSGGRMSKTHQHVRLTANALKTTLGLELDTREQELEEKYRASASTEQREDRG